MENAVTKYEGESLTAVQIKAQVNLIQEVMAAVMKEGHHYGIIPGTPKPTLYKPGSEKLLSTFRIGVDPSGDSVTDLSTHDAVRYRVAARGFSQTTGVLLGVGIGECSSDEEKYKWRKPVCDEEFNETPEDRKRLVWKKYGGNPSQQKQVRMNPADVANTILKMAKKRAQIDLTLTVTAASDIFDQDLEDMDETVRESVTNGKEKKPPLKEPQKKADKGAEKAPALSVDITLTGITHKDGEKNGKPWRAYYVMADNGEKFGTFSDTDADVATMIMNKGVKARITYNVGKYGNNLTGIEEAPA